MGAASLPVDEGWFASDEVEPGVFCINEPHMYSWIRGNVWLVPGRDADLLVDTANGVAPLRPFIDRFRPDPGKPVVAVVTHAHSDHMGGLHEFDERLAHELEAPDVAGARDGGTLIPAEMPQDFQDALTKDGTPLPDSFIDAVPSEGYELSSYGLIGTDPTRTVAEGDTVDLGDRTFTVFHTPGHTQGSMVLFEEATGTLFSGDTVYRDDELLDELPNSSIPDFVRSMRRLREFPVRIVHGGHDPSFGRQRLIERCNEYEARRGAVLSTS
ncbi:MAG: MBL fold metallo-hydrolase [Actinomycetota bacterium]